MGAARVAATMRCVVTGDGSAPAPAELPAAAVAMGSFDGGCAITANAAGSAIRGCGDESGDDAADADAAAAEAAVTAAAAAAAAAAGSAGGCAAVAVTVGARGSMRWREMGSTASMPSARKRARSRGATKR